MTSSEPRLAGLSLKGFTEMNVSDSVYQNDLWPQLEQSIDLILSFDTEQASRISFEENYSTVYKIVCKGYGSVLYEDLLHKKIDLFIDKLDESLLRPMHENSKEYIERFDEALRHFNRSIKSLLSIFVYLSRCMMNGALDKIVYERLNNRFVKKHVSTVLEYLAKAEYQPFAVEPTTFSNIITTLYTLDEEYAKLNPRMFSKFIPGYMCGTRADQLKALSAEAIEMSRQLQSSAPHSPSSTHKRPLEEESIMQLPAEAQMDT